MAAQRCLVVPAVVLLVAGLALGAGAMVEQSSASPAEYDHFADRVDAERVEDVPRDARYNFSDLSTESQLLFLQSVDNGGDYRSEGRSMAEFRYAQDSASLGNGWYYVRYDGQWWELHLSHASSVFDGMLTALAVLSALVMVAVGLWGLVRPRSRVPSAVLIGTVTWGIPVMVYVTVSASVNLWWVLAGILAGLAAIPLGIVALGRWDRWPAPAD